MLLKSFLGLACLLSFVAQSPAAPRCCCESPEPMGCTISNSTPLAEQGFTSIFDGKTLHGWTGATTGYVVEDGLLVCLKQGGGVLRTEKLFKDFVFRFEFRNEPGGNNGVGIRMPEKGPYSREGMEIQVLDDSHPKYAKLQPYQFHGSVYGVVPAKRGYLKPAGEWNREEIRIQGSQIRVTLNGGVIVDADLSKIKEPMDHRDHPGIKRTDGYLGFLGHGSRVEFRNLRVREL
jgi:hypothetical protein